jgi:M6 family metalloprotease-like protein
MPNTAASYHLTRADTSNDDGHRTLIGDAIAAADPTYDFSQTDIVYVVTAKTPLIDFSPTSRNFPRHWIADGHGLAPAITFGSDAYTYGRTILPHETGHLLGLPDLYSLAGGDDIHHFVGTWDLMGDVFQASDYFAWHRLKLGWLDPAQLVCAPSGRTITVELRPVETQTGTKAIFARTGPGTGVIIENRQRIGNDASICDTGALVYKVDSAIATGDGPIKVLGGTHAGCGLGVLSDAPLHKGQGGTVSGVKIAVVGTHGANVIVRVTRP